MTYSFFELPAIFICFISAFALQTESFSPDLPTAVYPQTDKHIYDIDLLRVIGAFGVLMYHYTARNITVDGIKVPLFPSIAVISKYGFLGLNLFFMISGFVILFSAMNKPAMDFAVSRIDRLYPTYWICVTCTLVAAYLFGQGFSLNQYLWNLTMFNDYFNVPDLDGVYWTLHVEIKFYLCIFLLMILGFIHQHRIWLTLWLLVTLSYLILHQPFFMGWFISPFYSSYFIGGILFYLLYTGDRGLINHAYLILTLAISMIYSTKQVDGFISSPSMMDRFFAAIIVFASYVFFYLVSMKKIAINKSKNWVLLGALTYPLYLIHAGIGKKLFDIMLPHINKYILLLLVTVTMLVISYLIYKLVEYMLDGRIKRFVYRALPSSLIN